MSALEQPTTTAEAAAVLRGTAGSVLFRGGGTKLDWGGRVDEPDLVVGTDRLRGVMTHEPADMTASVGAGTTLTELQDHVSGDGQWLALDPASAPHGATVGGILASGDAGPSRLRYGAPRDLVIGVTLVLADGTVARSGGHVIKNVAGYDLSTLVHGSLGTLALVSEVVVRLHPHPVASVTTCAEADAGAATAAARAIAESPLEPTAVEWSTEGGVGGTGRLLVRSDGSGPSAEAAAERIEKLLAGLGLAASTLPAEEAASVWRRHAAVARAADGETTVRVSGLPSDLAALAAHADRAAATHGVEADLVSSAALGLHVLRVHGGDAAAHGRTVADVRAHALAHGAGVLVLDRPREVDEHLDVLGPPPSAVGLLRRVKAQLDPHDRCAPGRFRPWY